MPTAPGIPILQGGEGQPAGGNLPGGAFPGSQAAPSYIGAAHPVNWLDRAMNEAAGLQSESTHRGRPMPFSWWQRRSIPNQPTIPQPVPVYVTSRPYSRGADAHAPQFGSLSYSPIGAGIYPPYKLPPMAGPGARYANSAIWFDVQAIPTSLRFGPTVPIETIAALLATASVGPSYQTTG
jgi:hypothetical protein